MKKKTKNIIIMLVVLLAVGGIAAALLLNPKEDTAEEPSSSTATEIIPVVEKTAADLSSISVKNAADQFVITAKQIAADEATETKASTEFSLEGFDGVALNASNLSSAANTVVSLNAVKQLDTPEKLADFGLDGEGEATLTLQYTDGTHETLIVGLPSSGTTGRYVLKDKNVYIVSSVSQSFFDTALSFVDTAVLAIPDVEVTDAEGNVSAGADVLTALTLSGKQFPEQIEIALNPNDSTSMSPNRVLAPIEADGNSTAISEITTALRTITATNVVQVKADDADFETYGLAEPYAQADFEINGEKHTVKISDANENKNHYLVIDDNKTIYEVPSSSVSVWSDAKLDKLRASYILLSNIQDVSKLTYTKSDSTYVFDMTREKNEEKSTDDAIQYDISATFNGGSIDYSKTYQPMYSAMLSLPILSSEVVEYDKASPIFSMQYDYFEGGSDVVKFYALEGQDRYVAELNGKYSGILRKVSLDDFITLLDRASKNEVLKES
ncbi:DUF4340 domain-containing protein [Scatolibacter rhodanostii]|uniref:DUF4340 domain-containing protein n=1 Tax=Scatolibacter rhodanostii TaxID=2014781 RepID=UPI000C077ADD|nr:DUF4340 domain-containing protein [Scatolibacter rhodanostii]